MPPETQHQPSRISLLFKWGGCFTAFVFAFGGLTLDLASPSPAYETLSAGTWAIVAIGTALGFAGVVLDRAHTSPKPRDPHRGP